jgi:WD40 repeat protein
MEYLSNQNLIATSSNDLTINFWDASSYSLKQILSVPEIQLCVRYADWKSANTQLLYTGGSDSIIHVYDATTLK